MYSKFSNEHMGDVSGVKSGVNTPNYNNTSINFGHQSNKSESIKPYEMKNNLEINSLKNSIISNDMTMTNQSVLHEKRQLTINEMPENENFGTKYY